MMQQGGVSKATKTINLSEDIFAGMDFTLRGQRGSEVGKWGLLLGGAEKAHGQNWGCCKGHMAWTAVWILMDIWPHDG